MFPISVYFRYELVGVLDESAVLDSISDALSRDGISEIKREYNHLKFRNPSMIVLSYRLFSPVSSGEFIAFLKDEKVIIESKLRLWKVLISIIPVLLLSYGITQADNIDVVEKTQLIVFFFSFFIIGSYFIATLRLRRWLNKCMRLIETDLIRRKHA